MEMHVRRFHMLHVALQGDDIILAPNIVDGPLAVSRGTIPIPGSHWHLELEVPMQGRQHIAPGNLLMFANRLWKAYEDADMKRHITACETVLHIGSPPSININMGAKGENITYDTRSLMRFQTGVDVAMQTFGLRDYKLKLVSDKA